MDIKASIVNELRNRTNAGIMDCKKALFATNGNLEEAIDYLKKQGIAAVAKKANRETKEGAILLSFKDNNSVILELNCETDFVAKSSEFQNLLNSIGKLLIENNKPAIDAEIANTISIIGENIVLKRFELVSSENLIFSYVHNAYSKNSGKIGVLLVLDSSKNYEALKEIGLHLCMHIAAMNPLGLNISDLDAKVVEREKQIFIEQSKNTNKPEAVVNKMIEGRIRKFYEDVVLLKQTFIIDNKTKIEDLLQSNDVTIKKFIRYSLSE